MVIKNIQHFSDINNIREAECFLDECEINPDLGDDRIVLFGLMYRLRNTHYLIAEGTYYAFNEDTGTLEPDFCVSLLYDSSHGLDLDKPMYWEGCDCQVMFHNYVIKSINKNDGSMVFLEACVA